MTEFSIMNADCRKAEALLSEYVDDTLSARDMFEVEKHLAGCKPCSHTAELMQSTVNILRAAEALDTSNDFMAKLHSRLDTLGPVPARRSLVGSFKDWLADVRQQINRKPIPALSLGMASFIAVAALFNVSRGPAVGIKIDVAEHVSQVDLDRHVAVTASNPFDDPVAAKLEAEGNGSGSSSGSPTESNSRPTTD